MLPYATNTQCLSFIGKLRTNSDDPLVSPGTLDADNEAAAVRVKVLLEEIGAPEDQNPFTSAPLQRLAAFLNAKLFVLDKVEDKASGIDPNYLGYYKSIEAFFTFEVGLIEANQLLAVMFPIDYGFPSTGFPLNLPSIDCSVDAVMGMVDGWDADNTKDAPSRTTVEDWILSILVIVYGYGYQHGYLIPTTATTLNSYQINIYTKLATEWTAALVLQSRLWSSPNSSIEDMLAYNKVKSVKGLLQEFISPATQKLMAGQQLF